MGVVVRLIFKGLLSQNTGSHGFLLLVFIEPSTFFFA